MVLSSVVFWEETKRRRNHTTEEGKFHDAAMHMPRYHKISPPGRVNRKVGRIMGNQDSKGIVDRFSRVSCKYWIGSSLLENRLK